MSSRREQYKKFAAQHANVGFDARNVSLNATKGTWSLGFGDDAADITGKELLADIHNASRGLRKFPTDARHRAPIWAVTLIASDTPPPDRALLGDLDQARWLIGKYSHEPRDPWQPVSCLPLIDPSTLEVFLYATESGSGSAAVAMLMDAWLARTTPPDSLPDKPPANGNGQAHPEEDEIPRVALGSRAISLDGGDRTLYVPTLRIVGWESRPEGARILTPPPLPLPPSNDLQGELGFYNSNNAPYE
jgi:hypothetical protein